MNAAAKVFSSSSRLLRTSLISKFSIGKVFVAPGSLTYHSLCKANQAQVFVRNAVFISAKTRYSTEGDLRKLSNEEWLKRLTPEQYYVCREKGTEEPFSGDYCSHHEEGLYSCVCCGAALFSSETKFESNSGWPAFSLRYGDDANGEIEVNVLKRPDNSLGMSRTEVICKKCHSHLGHVFDDGPAPSGDRYCVNSTALAFRKQKMK